jgi:nicotinate-nucleotide pyrophosphorylase (carboxylating)
MDAGLDRLIQLAQEEDLGAGDLSSGLLSDPTAAASFAIVAKSQGLFAGQEVAAEVLRAYDPAIEIRWLPGVADGLVLANIPVDLATLCGPLASLLSAERVLLNFLQRLSGVATATRRFVDLVSGTSAAIYDTRKTTPGWRKLEKYAVRCGGGLNHRDGLFDAVLIKDNHLAGVPVRRLGGFVFDLLNRLAELKWKPAFVEVEADSLEQVEVLLSVVGIDIILLDNFSVDDLHKAVKLRDSMGLARKIELEASGGVSLANVRAIAETGVDRISVGAITHSVVALDMSLEPR